MAPASGGEPALSRYPRLAAALSWVEFLRVPPGAIAREFTLGQLAVIAWAMEQRTVEFSWSNGIEAHDNETDLRQLTGAQLATHLAQLDACDNRVTYNLPS
jgi:hypothetical protein